MRMLATILPLVAALGALGLGGCTAAEDAPSNQSASATDGTGAQPRMVMLSAAYCPVCRQMEPLVDELIARCRQQGISIEKIDVAKETNEHLIDEYRVVGVPTFLFVDGDGTEVARLIGRQTPDALKQALSALKGEECPGMSKIARSKN